MQKEMSAMLRMAAAACIDLVFLRLVAREDRMRLVNLQERSHQRFQRDRARTLLTLPLQGLGNLVSLPHPRGHLKPVFLLLSSLFERRNLSRHAWW